MRIALVVGGTSGLGRAVALLLEGEYEVHVAARKSDVNPWFPFHPCDITKVEDRQRLVAAFPKLDALIITAGTSTDDLRGTNCTGPISLAMDFLPALKGGSVTFVSSTAAVLGDSDYGRKKAELEAMVDDMARTVVGVRVNCVRPTHIVGGGLSTDPMGEPTVTLHEVASAICFLVENGAMHGVVLPVDRGVSL